MAKSATKDNAPRVNIFAGRERVETPGRVSWVDPNGASKPIVFNRRDMSRRTASRWASPGAAEAQSKAMKAYHAAKTGGSAKAKVTKAPAKAKAVKAAKTTKPGKAKRTRRAKPSTGAAA